MNAKRGYYSLIQFCPDPSRLEAVNVGVVLFCPEAGFIAARTTRGNQRAAKLVGRSAISKSSINSAKRAIERRLEVNREEFASLEDLQKFVDTRANVLKLTNPRPIKVFDPDQDLQKLFQELVGGVSRQAEPETVVPSTPRLDAVFNQLQQEGRATLDVNITVPVIGQSMHIPYAYRNGALNLIKPQRFAAREKSAIGTAMKLAIEGDLLFNHGADERGSKKLVIVTSFEPDGNVQQVENRVYEVLQAYNVKTVPDAEVEAFVSEVMKEAHA